MKRILAAGFAVAAAAALFCGCQTIAGIKDHAYTPLNPQCEQYCDLVESACDAGAYSSIYPDRETCLGLCSRLDPNPSFSGNTLGCRENVLNSGERSECAKAGPGGGGTCGSNCESYCSLDSQICPTQFAADFGSGSDALTNCENKCKVLPDDKGFDIAADSAGNTVECRLAHLSAAANVPESDRATECARAQIRAAEGCTEDPTSSTFCDNFCTFNGNTCAADMAVYESREQCLSVCQALPAGETNDATHNTRACRFYHTYNALLIGPPHCSHTGPGGDGHCGPTEMDAGTGNCESYCILLEEACPDTFQATYTSADKRAECEAACNALPGAARDTGYSVQDAGKGNVQCRLLHLSRALEHPDAGATECESAIGNGDCMP